MMNPRMKGCRGEKRKEKCVTKEKWCYYCYVGGILLFCDQEDCLKACHPKCLGKDDSFVNIGNSWTCRQKEVEENSPHSVPLDDRDLKWNFITPEGRVSGPYPLDGLKDIVEVLPNFSKNLMVWKGANTDGAMKIQDAIDQENTENNVTEGPKQVEENGPPSVWLDDRDLKWNIITPDGRVSGPYSLDGLKDIVEVLPNFSQNLMVWKGANRDGAMKIQDAIDQENTENNVTEGEERVEDSGPVFDEQLEAILKKLPERNPTNLNPTSQ